MFLYSYTIVKNDLAINSGTLENDRNINIGRNWINNVGIGGFVDNGDMVTFDGSNDSQINFSETFEHLTIDKTSSSLDIPTGITLTIEFELFIDNGVLNVGNDASLIFGNHADININNGVLNVGDNVNLYIGDELNVNDGGMLDITCTLGSEATITQNVSPYDFNIESGGTIKASNAIFEGFTVNGIYLQEGSIVDEIHSFNNCTFRSGEGNGTLLTIDNDQVFTIDGANFPENTWDG